MYFCSLKLSPLKLWSGGRNLTGNLLTLWKSPKNTVPKMPLSSWLYKLPLFITSHLLLSLVSSTATLPYILKMVLLKQTRTSQDKPHMPLLHKETKKSIGTTARIHSNQRRKLNKRNWHLWSPFLVPSHHTLSTVTPDSASLSSNTPRHWMEEITWQHLPFFVVVYQYNLAI